MVRCTWDRAEDPAAEQAPPKSGARVGGRVLSSNACTQIDEEPKKRDTPSYHGYRFPPEIISHAVWLSHRFGVSFRDVEDLLAQRGLTVHESRECTVSRPMFTMIWRMRSKNRVRSPV